MRTGRAAASALSGAISDEIVSRAWVKAAVKEARVPRRRFQPKIRRAKKSSTAGRPAPGGASLGSGMAFIEGQGGCLLLKSK